MGSIAVQPDIGYAPDVAKYKARTQRRLENDHDLINQSLPEGFPKHLDGELVWEGGSSFETKGDWTYQLNEQDLTEVEMALKHFKSLRLSLGHISQTTFPLSNLHDKLRQVSHELHFGRGFQIVSGLPVQSHNREENIIIYAGISSHIAPLRARQDSSYQGKPADVVLNHIRDLSSTVEKGNIGAPAYTADKQVFHTDAGDIVSLFALSEAAEGGTSRLASTWRVYNELAATRPDLIRTLAGDWIADNFSQPTNPTIRPLLHHQPATPTSPERISLQYARRYFTGFGALPRSTSIPPITEAQAEALDALHFLGEKFNVGLSFKQGDVQYVNNLAVFHARDGFKDTDEKRRHLVRLWLRDPEYAWDTPGALQDKWRDLYDGVTAESQVFPLEPYVRGSSNGSARDKKDEKDL